MHPVTAFAARVAVPERVELCAGMVQHNCASLQERGNSADADEDAPLWDILILDEARALFRLVAPA